MKKTIFGKLGWMKMGLFLALIPMVWGCGQSNFSPTSANTTSMTSSKIVAQAATSTVTATAGGAWVNTAFTALTTDFTVNFDASVSAAPTNAIVGISSGAQTAYASFAGLVRFNPTGDIDAYNEAIPNYAGPAAAIPYTAGTTYSFTILLHMAAQTYDISVSSNGGAAQMIGTGFKFRAAATSLNNYGAFVSATGGSGTLTVNNFTAAVPATPTFTFTPTFTSTSTTTGVSTWRVNAGGSVYTDSLGNVWAADENFIGGTVGSVSTGTVAGTSDPILYQTQRYGNPFSYSFPVPNGSYQVTLKFMENKFTAPGGRVFNVAINGTTVLTNFDIYATAGAANQALDEVFDNVTVTNGTIAINPGPATANNAKIDAIQIIPESAAPKPTNTPTFTNTFTPTNTFTATNTFTITNTPTSTFTPTKTFTPTNTFTSTPTKVPPTATPTPVPAHGINFAQWYLQEPSGSGTSPTTIPSSTLVKGYSDAYFYIDSSNGFQAFMDPQTGITTSGSQHPRCEMHETTTWGSGGTNTCTVTGRIKQINGDTTTVGQMFNNNDSITLVELQYSKSKGGFEVFYEEAKGAGSYPTQTFVGAAMGSTYTYTMSLSGGVAKVTINGTLAFTKTVGSAVSGNQFYFKVGNYDQSAVKGSVSTTPYSIVEAGSAVIVHK